MARDRCSFLGLQGLALRGHFGDAHNRPPVKGDLPPEVPFGLVLLQHDRQGMSFVIWHLALVLCHGPVTSPLSPVIGHLSFVTCHLAFVICHLPLPSAVTQSVLFSAFSAFFAVRRRRRPPFALTQIPPFSLCPPRPLR